MNSQARRVSLTFVTDHLSAPRTFLHRLPKRHPFGAGGGAAASRSVRGNFRAPRGIRDSFLSDVSPRRALASSFGRAALSTLTRASNSASLGCRAAPAAARPLAKKLFPAATTSRPLRRLCCALVSGGSSSFERLAGVASRRRTPKFFYENRKKLLTPGTATIQFAQVLLYGEEIR